MAAPLGAPLCLKSELDHFSLPPTQTALDSARYVLYNPSGNSLNGDTISWEIAGTPDECVDFAHSSLLLDVGFRTAAGVAVPVAIEFGPVNLFSRSLFAGHELLLNNEPVSSIPSLSHYAAFFETLLNYGNDSLPQLENSGFVLDTPLTHDTALLAAPDPNPQGINVNEGFIRRHLEHTTNGGIWRMFCKIPTELANQHLLLPPKIDMKLTLTRARDAFSLMSNVVPLDAKIVITKAVLKLRKYKMDPEFLLAHEMMLQKRNALIPFVESQVIEMTIPQGSSHWSRDDLFRGTIPKKLLVAFVDSRAVGGNLQLNPYKFQHLNIAQIVTYVNSEPLPSKTLQLDLTQHDSRDAYLSLLETTGMLHKNASLMFSEKAWRGGYSIFGFNLEPDVGDGSCLNVPKKGILGLSCTFAAPTTATYSVLIYYNKDGLIEIDSRRNIFLPYKRS